MVPTVIIIIVNATSASAANRDPMEPEIQTAALHIPGPLQTAERQNQSCTTSDAVFTPWIPNVSLELQPDDRSSASIAASFEGDGAAAKSKCGEETRDPT